MTKSQEKRIDQIRQATINQLFYDKEKYEFKKWEIDTLCDGKIVALSFEVGMKNDEGTMAQVFCRDRGIIFIGSKGGMTYYNKKNKRKVLKYLNILSVTLSY